VSCTLSFVNITGNVRVESDATLIVSGYTELPEPRGDIESKNCKSVLLQGNVTVCGNLNRAWLGTFDEGVHIQSNQAQAASDVSLVSVGENLSCEGNSTAVTHSLGSSVDGHWQGQCAGFSATTTSIATSVTPMRCANLATLSASRFAVPNTVDDPDLVWRGARGFWHFCETMPR
jgi:hypothetical protein